MNAKQEPRFIRDVLGWVVARWSGEIDMANADDLAREALAEVDNRDHGLLLDLSQVSYLDSAGIGWLVRLSRLLRERQLGFRLVVPERSVLRSSLEVGGIPGLVPTFPTVAAAQTDR